jgi:hypothetical protein
MTLKEFITMMQDNYTKIRVEVFSKESSLVNERFDIQPHKCNNYSVDIPADIKKLKVGAMILYYDSLVVTVEQ